MEIYECLYGEYQDAINKQNRAIEQNNMKLKNARKKSDFKEIKRLNSYLLVLYEERSELMERANRLRQYIS